MSTAKQPEPMLNDNPAIWDLVFTDARAMPDGYGVRDAMVADMRERDALGHRHYKVRLQADNGRDALKDAYEEALDLCAYARQAKEEGALGAPGFYRRALALAYDMRGAMYVRDAK